MPKFVTAGKKWVGVQYYESTNRRHNGRPDRCYYIRYRNAQDKMVREKIGWASEKYTPQTAAHIRAERIRSIRHGEDLPRKKERPLTCNELSERYFKGPGALIKSIRNDENRWENHLKIGLGSKEPGVITQLDIDKLIKDLKNREKSAGTIWNVLELFRRIVNFGADRNLSPPLSFKLKMPKRNSEKTEVLSPEEWERLKAALNEYPNQASANMVRIAAFGGLRKSEIFGLKWEDIDFLHRIIRISNPKSGEPEKIPMNDLLYETLKTHPKFDSEYVFPGRSGKKRGDSKVAQRIKKMAKLPDDFRPWHGLRHAYASALAESGEVDLYHLMKLMRHRSPQMTQRYAHLRDKSLLDASNKLGAMISKKKED
ncbi:Site-specific recombinase XerD [Desulfatibacillum alkenivorans DSM 16219]|uniref:Site-specific recombinase XerD n=1 Tax=Desulfatibacillum alkenivorans DSM 16219 TaxID=1121393 RepID=A0A1M6Q9M4_9BACT|nr:site-specific integrase [Desulfatibacillum alkenivorans]SHK16979.1 Site-specific recombinase XerD [Desulfatibacillum alkenivorans DSM 16219]